MNSTPPPLVSIRANSRTRRRRESRRRQRMLMMSMNQEQVQTFYRLARAATAETTPLTNSLEVLRSRLSDASVLAERLLETELTPLIAQWVYTYERLITAELLRLIEFSDDEESEWPPT